MKTTHRARRALAISGAVLGLSAGMAVPAVADPSPNGPGQPGAPGTTCGSSNAGTTPGNAVNAMLAKFPQLDANSLKALEAEFGTHAHGSLLSQYFTYLGNLAHGDLGLSVNQYPAKVTTIIGQTLPWTVILVGTATIIAAYVCALHLMFAPTAAAEMPAAIETHGM